MKEVQIWNQWFRFQYILFTSIPTSSLIWCFFYSSTTNESIQPFHKSSKYILIILLQYTVTQTHKKSLLSLEHSRSVAIPLSLLLRTSLLLLRTEVTAITTNEHWKFRQNKLLLFDIVHSIFSLSTRVFESHSKIMLLTNTIFIISKQRQSRGYE